MNWKVCNKCFGVGKTTKKVKNKKNQLIVDSDSSSHENSIHPTYIKCKLCDGKGLVEASEPNLALIDKFPHISIIGVGIGGVALAVACLHRGIPFTIFERDTDFNSRSQGYGLTLQQASKAMKSFGILNLPEGIVSNKHIVHNVSGEVIGEWGARKWLQLESLQESKNNNIHIARQSLRYVFLKQINTVDTIKWNHKFLDYKIEKDHKISIRLLNNTQETYFKTDILVGADGIRSAVRKQWLKDESQPLKYLNCMVVLGICDLSNLDDVSSSLLDLKTVFQTANGHDRMYMMPYAKGKIMWQLSFPIEESIAKALHNKGSLSLKKEALKRTDWHFPIPQIIEATLPEMISGYPVYDRDITNKSWNHKNENITILGDAAHPMSPFKGQGANQALLDALLLAQMIYKNYSRKQFQNQNIREDVLNKFEFEMMERSIKKMKESANAVEFLHSDDFFIGGNQPRRFSDK